MRRGKQEEKVGSKMNSRYDKKFTQFVKVQKKNHKKIHQEKSKSDGKLWSNVVRTCVRVRVRHFPQQQIINIIVDPKSEIGHIFRAITQKKHKKLKATYRRRTRTLNSHTSIAKSEMKYIGHTTYIRRKKLQIAKLFYSYSHRIVQFSNLISIVTSSV